MLITSNPRGLRLCALVASGTALGALSYSLASPVRARAATSSAPHSSAPQLTASALAADLRAGSAVMTVPSDLQPPLAAARWIRPGVVLNGCSLGRAGVWRKPCVYGDTASRTTVVVFGDSHAAMWFTALDVISNQQHWRLIDLTKSGCPPVEVDVMAWFAHGALYSACSRWRAHALAYISALHPALVVVTWARWLEQPEARPTAGVPAGYGGAWLDGVAALFGFLRHAAAHVVFISDIPTLRQPVWVCLPAHLSDVPACTVTPRVSIRRPSVRAGELRLAKQEHVDSIDPTSWFCTSTRCPVIVGDLLVYHDNSHMTPQWAEFIAPLLADGILGVIHHAWASGAAAGGS